jgi:hypothetical protein
MPIPGGPGGGSQPVARMTGTNRALTVLITNTGAANVVVGVSTGTTTVSLAAQQSVAYSITSGDLTVHNTGSGDGSVQLYFSDAP